jgi:hypothetical protein
MQNDSGSFAVHRCARAGIASLVMAMVVIAACSSSSNHADAGAAGSSSGGPLLCQTVAPEIADAAALVEEGGAVCSTAGGPTACPTDMPCADTHCAGPGNDEPGDAGDGGNAGDAGEALRQMTTPAACCDTNASSDSGDAGGEACNSMEMSIGPDNGTCCDPGYQPTMFGQMGSDDACKYDVSWTSTPICKNAPVYFTVHANYRYGATTFGSGAPLTGAGVFAEVVQNCTTATSPSCSPTNPPPCQRLPVEFAPGVYQVGPIQFTESGKWSVRFHFNDHCDDVVPESPHGHAAFWITVP